MSKHRTNQRPRPPKKKDTTTFDSSSFDATGLSASSFSDEIKTLADNSSKLDSVLALNSSLYKTPPPANTSSPNASAGSKTNPFAAFTGPAVAKLRSANPLGVAAKLNTATYDMFQNTTDTDQLTGSCSTSGVSCSGLSSFGTSANSTSTAPNYHVSSHQHQVSSSTTAAADASESSDALFQDFALSAFNEFKRDLSNSNQQQQQRRGGGGGAGENNSKQRMSSTMNPVTHHHAPAAGGGARLIPEKVWPVCGGE